MAKTAPKKVAKIIPDSVADFIIDEMIMPFRNQKQGKGERKNAYEKAKP